MLGEVKRQVFIPGVLHAGIAAAIAFIETAHIFHQQLGIVLNAGFSLKLAVDADQRAAADGAAHPVGLFQDDDLRAVFTGLNGRAHAGHAGADHQHIRILNG